MSIILCLQYFHDSTAVLREGHYTQIKEILAESLMNRLSTQKKKSIFFLYVKVYDGSIADVTYLTSLQVMAEKVDGPAISPFAPTT